MMEMTTLSFGLANKMRSFADGFEWLSNAVTSPAPLALMQMHLVTPPPLLLRITKPTGGNTCAAVEPKPEPLVRKACSKSPDLHKSPHITLLQAIHSMRSKPALKRNRIEDEVTGEYHP